MIFTPTRLDGVWLVEPERISDERGFFARTWCSRDFEERGLNPRLAQCNVSFNHRKGTLRGLHWQRGPHAECKLVRCTRGAIFDVVVDLRKESATFQQWFGVELTAGNRRMLYIPEAVAHGFMTLNNDSEVFYQMSAVHVPGSAAGVRWNDPAFGIAWPATPEVISERDRNYRDFAVECGLGSTWRTAP